MCLYTTTKHILDDIVSKDLMWEHIYCIYFLRFTPAHFWRFSLNIFSCSRTYSRILLMRIYDHTLFSRVSTFILPHPYFICCVRMEYLFKVTFSLHFWVGENRFDIFHAARECCLFFWFCNSSISSYLLGARDRNCNEITYMKCNLLWEMGDEIFIRRKQASCSNEFTYWVGNVFRHWLAL